MNRWARVPGLGGILAALAAACGGEPTAPGGDGGPPRQVYAVVYPAAETLLLRQTVTLSAWTQDSAGRRSGGPTSWAVSDSSIVSLAVTAPLTVLVTAVRSGTTTITATVNSYAAHATVRVRPLFSVSPRLPSLFAGDTLLLTVWLDDGRSAAHSVTATLVARDPAIASVSSNGVVTGVSPGWGTVAGSYQEETTSVQVAVLQPPLGTNRELSFRCGGSRLCIAGSAGLDTVTPAGESVEEHAWSPDGTRLAVAYSNVWSRYGVFVSGPDGSGVQLVAAGGRSPAWAPDGARIAFEGADRVIWTVQLASGARSRLTAATTQESFPQWSPDGRQVAFIGAASTWTTGPGGVQVSVPTVWLKSVVDTVPAREIRLPVVPGSLSWSPDGKYLAFTSAFTAAGALQPGGVWVVGVEGTGAHPVSSNCMPAGTCVHPHHVLPDWSPDATRLAWSTLLSADSLGDNHVVIGHRETGEVSRFRTAACCSQAVFSLPRWAPDGTVIAYFARSATDSVVELRVAAPDGSGMRVVAPAEGDGLRWRP